VSKFDSGHSGASQGPTQSPKAVFRELGSVVTVEPKWSLEGVFPSRAVFKVAARHETRCEWADLIGLIAAPDGPNLIEQFVYRDLSAS
jgi:hypothetical protein